MSQYTGSATIYRCAPWAKDPSVSGAGHDRAIQSPFPINETELTAWLTEHAPEVIDAEPVRFLDDDDPRNYYYLIGRDNRDSVYLGVHTPVSFDTALMRC